MKFKISSCIISIIISFVVIGTSLTIGLIFNDDGIIEAITAMFFVCGLIALTASVIVLIYAAKTKKRLIIQLDPATTTTYLSEKNQTEPSTNKRKFSTKVRVAFILLILQILLSLGNVMKTYQNFSIIISFIFECLPVIAAIILIYYEHVYHSPISGKFTLLRKWELALIWIQPALSLLSYASADLLNEYIVALWIGGCVFIIISTILLYLDGKGK